MSRRRRQGVGSGGWRRCVYCGLPTPKAPACIAHAGLVALDPFYRPVVELELASSSLAARSGSASSSPFTGGAA